MNIYHGTILDYAKNIFDNGILVDYEEANRGTDFGVGFYTTDCYELAEKTARTKAQYHKDDDINNTPVVIRMKYNPIDSRGYSIKKFFTCDNNWKSFICANRYKKVRENNCSIDSNIDLKYDLVMGAVADSSFPDIRSYLRENDYIITQNILDSLSPFKITNFTPKQISFHNQDLASCIKLIDYDIIY